MIDLTQLLVGGVPILVVIFGLVEFSKEFGLKGRWLTLFSLLLGIAFGAAWSIAYQGVPTDFQHWFILIMLGLALGLTTCGLYDFADARLPRVGP